MALGLSLPLPNIAGTKPPKPDPTREQFALAMNEGVTRKVTAFAVERAKLTAVEAATTAEELVAI